MKNQVNQIDTKTITPGDNDRTVFEPAALRELAGSISEHGLIQPITVRRIDGTEMYQIVAGERRYRACTQVLDWEEIPAIVADLTDEEASAVMLAENVARADLDPIDEGIAYQSRIDRFNWSVAEIAERAGVSAVRVRFRLKLLGLRPNLQKLVRDGNLELGYAQIIAQADLDNNRQLIAVAALRDNAAPTMSWFRHVVSKLAEEQNQESMFDMAALESVEEAAALFDLDALVATPDTNPAQPGKDTPPATGETPAEILKGQINFWDQAAMAWDKLGKTFKKQECMAAAHALRCALKAIS